MFFPKSKSGHYKMSTLHFSSDIGLGPGPLADPWKNCEVDIFFLPRSQKLANLYRYRPPGRPSQLLRRHGPKMPGAIVCDRWREMPAE